MSQQFDSIQFDISTAADQCVMCGMCLPHCPTYQVSQQEAESPRGRISLIKAFSQGKLEASKTLEAHIYSCTGCLKCQQICPANVNFQDIIDTGKNKYRTQQSAPKRLLQDLTIHAATHGYAHSLLKLTAPILKFAPIGKTQKRLLAHINRHSHIRANNHNHADKVMLFTGCSGNLFDQETANSLIKLLNAIEVDVVIPDETLCCGAIAQHSGSLELAKKNIEHLHDYVTKGMPKTCLSFASGCGRQLKEKLNNEIVNHFDAFDWLNQHQNFNQLRYADNKIHALIHQPCTSDSNNFRTSYECLLQIPGLQLQEFSGNLSCCGAGGVQLVSPEQSNRQLIEHKIKAIQLINPDIIVSANIGCSLNFKQALASAGLNIEVVHPLTLLARQLIITDE